MKPSDRSRITGFIVVALLIGWLVVDPPDAARTFFAAPAFPYWLAAIALVLGALAIAYRARNLTRRLRSGEAHELPRRVRGRAGTGQGRLPGWLAEGEAALVAGPEPMPLSRLVSEARTAGAGVVVASAERPAMDPRVAWLPPPALPSELRRRAQDLHAAAGAVVVVVGEASALDGALPAERAESRLARLLDDLDGLPAAVVLREPLPVDRVVRPDPVGRRLVDRVQHTWLWSGEARTAPSRERGGLGWWLVVRGTPRAYSPACEWWEGALAWSLTLAACMAAALLVCLPALTAKNTLLGSASQDLPGSLWSDWWVSRWVAGHGELLHTKLLYWPSGAAVVPLFGNLLAALISVPFQRLLGYPAHWNAFVVAGLVTGGLSAGLLARQAGASRGGAALAAVAFTVAPPLLAEVSTGRQDLIWSFPLPLALAAGLRALDGGRARDGWLAGAALGLASLGWWFHGAVAGAILLALGIARWHRLPLARPVLAQQAGRAIRCWLPVLLAAAPILAAINHGDLPGFFLGRLPASTGGDMVEDILQQEVASHSLSLSALVVGGSAWPLHLVVLGVLLLAWLRPRTPASSWAWTAAIAASFALGPYLAGPDGWRPLPLAGLEAIVPFLSHLNQPDRMLVAASLAIAVCAALLVRPLTLTLPRGLRAIPVTAGLVAALALPHICGELPLRTTDFKVPHWYTALGDEGAILEVPVGMTEALAMYQPFGPHPLAGGPGVARRFAAGTRFHNALVSDEALAPLVDLQHLPSADLPEAAAARGLGYVVVENALIRRMMQEDDDFRVQSANRLAQRIDWLLGPPLISNPEVRVYRLPNATPSAAP